jgi:hypothetical protein
VKDRVLVLFLLQAGSSSKGCRQQTSRAIAATTCRLAASSKAGRVLARSQWAAPVPVSLFVDSLVLDNLPEDSLVLDNR